MGSERNAYRLYAGSYENSCETIVTHEAKFTATELNGMMHQCLYLAARAQRLQDLPLFRKQARKYRKHKVYGRMYRDLIRNPAIKVESVWDEAVSILCIKYGFTRQLYTAATEGIGAWAQCYPKYVPFGN